MTAEQLRQLLVRGVDKLLDNWFARRAMSGEEVRLARAQRAFWLAADTATLDRLLAVYHQEPVRSESGETVLPPQWVKGPLPPALYGLGAVVPATGEGSGRAHFAVFCGDHAKLEMVQTDTNGELSIVPVRVELSEVAFYRLSFA